MAEQETYECDCGAAFETEEELEQHARDEHDADVRLAPEGSDSPDS